jgi:NADPH-dependent ferric siderophore reductase
MLLDNKQIAIIGAGPVGLTLARLPSYTFVWIAAEASVARAIRSHFLDERNHPLGWMRAGGYWVMDRGDAHTRL